MDIKEAINSVVGRIRDKHHLDPKIGFEWEFQLLDDKGAPVPTEKVEALFAGNGSIDRIYDERGFGLSEITTKPLSPADAAQALQDVQDTVTGWAKEQGFHLSAAPIVVGRNGNLKAAAGSAGIHVNASLTDSNGRSALLVSDDNQMNPLAANVSRGILEVNAETPLWSFQDPQLDLLRLRRGDGTPDKYDTGCSKGSRTGKVGVSLNQNEAVPHPVSVVGNPFGVKDEEYAACTARTEERFPSSRTDPFAAAFRTVVGQYHGLENPVFTENVPKTAIDLGEIPKTWEELSAAHLPQGSVLSRYAGDLYDQATLTAIDERGKSPALMAKESRTFQYDPSYVPPVKETPPVAEKPVAANPVVKEPAGDKTLDVPPPPAPPVAATPITPQPIAPEPVATVPPAQPVSAPAATTAPPPPAETGPAQQASPAADTGSPQSTGNAAAAASSGLPPALEKALAAAKTQIAHIQDHVAHLKDGTASKGEKTAAVATVATAAVAVTLTAAAAIKHRRQKKLEQKQNGASDGHNLG